MSEVSTPPETAAPPVVPVIAPDVAPPAPQAHEIIADSVAGLEKYAPLGEQAILQSASQFIALLEAKLAQQSAISQQIAGKNAIAASLNPNPAFDK